MVPVPTGGQRVLQATAACQEGGGSVNDGGRIRRRRVRLDSGRQAARHAGGGRQAGGTSRGGYSGPTGGWRVLQAEGGRTWLAAR
jgi:hypothetical protein